MRLASRTGMGRSASEFSRVNAIVLTAIPSANVVTATTVKDGVPLSARIA
jgi:hypothetical protein